MDSETKTMEEGFENKHFDNNFIQCEAEQVKLLKVQFSLFSQDLNRNIKWI